MTRSFQGIPGAIAVLHTHSRRLDYHPHVHLVLRYVLPKGFRRARNFGFLHPNSKRLIRLLQ